MAYKAAQESHAVIIFYLPGGIVTLYVKRQLLQIHLFRELGQTNCNQLDAGIRIFPHISRADRENYPSSVHQRGCYVSPWTNKRSQVFAPE
jgi:hypothetical protein